MNKLRNRIRIALGTGFAALLATPAAMAQENVELEDIVVTGTRVADRSATDTAVPVDVVTAESLSNVGVTELNEALASALPSFNFPRPGLNDGTDTVRPATLRGLAPDQTLVLLNSKRRHAASLVNVNGSIGRGSAATDLNTIPTAAVQSIEVLRDGASAQYGSDAIAGVINVRLREASEGGAVSVTYGRTESSYTVPVTSPPAGASWSAPAKISRDASDGETVTVSAWKGLSFGENGYLTLTAEFKDQQRTERDGYDTRQQYPSLSGGSCSGSATSSSVYCDPRELTFDRFNAWYGDPELDQLTLFANFGTSLKSGAEVYGWASYQDRDAQSAGFYRRAQDSRNVLAIYPDGFLPIIAPRVTDASAALGVAWEWGDWAMDTSLVYGYNKMEFTIENTLNASLGAASGTVFDAGGFDYDQLVFNFSGVRQVDTGSLASPLNIAAGIEARVENYSIFQGEPDSWRNGGVLLPNGSPAQSGSQVFPGFQPSDEVDEDRTAIGAYVDVEANLTDKLLGSVAIRAEDYSDFGSNVSGKLALRYDFNENFALRGSVQNGFRAPSLQQQFFTSTATNFVLNTAGQSVPVDIVTLTSEDPAAIALGAESLDAETSINFSVGAVMHFGIVSVTIDAYRIDMEDRIVLSENLGASGSQAQRDAVLNYLRGLGYDTIGGARFFINGVDTKTQGVDVVVNWPVETSSAGRFDFTVVANYNQTDVTKVPATPEIDALNPPSDLFARNNILSFEEGTPESKYAAVIDWELSRFGATLKATHYGKALDPSTSASADFELGAKTLVDLEGRFDVTKSIRVALGVENLFDEYPDAFTLNRNTTGNTPFSNYSPFGRNGRFIYGRMSVNF